VPEPPFPGHKLRSLGSKTEKQMDTPQWLTLMEFSRQSPDTRQDPYLFLREVSQNKSQPLRICAEFAGHTQVMDVIVSGAIHDDPDGNPSGWWLLFGKVVGPGPFGSETFFRAMVHVETGRGVMGVFVTWTDAKTALLPGEM
jgi:hypothetical protein